MVLATPQTPPTEASSPLDTPGALRDPLRVSARWDVMLLVSDARPP